MDSLKRPYWIHSADKIWGAGQSVSAIQVDKLAESAEQVHTNHSGGRESFIFALNEESPGLKLGRPKPIDFRDHFGIQSDWFASARLGRIPQDLCFFSDLVNDHSSSDFFRSKCENLPEVVP